MPIELLRIPVPRTSVNKARRRAGAPRFGDSGLGFAPLIGGASCSATLAYRVDHAAVCGDGGLLGQRRIELALASRLEVVAAVVVEVHSVLDYGELAEVLEQQVEHRE